MNPYWTIPTEENETYDAGDCQLAVDNKIYRQNNNMLMNICFDSISYIKKQLEK